MIFPRVSIRLTLVMRGRALILRRSGGRWSAMHLRRLGREQQLEKHEILGAPKSGWEKAWQRLISAGLLTLPDASEVNCQVLAQDGMGRVATLVK